jgi:hypothetical protein
VDETRRHHHQNRSDLTPVQQYPEGRNGLHGLPQAHIIRQQDLGFGKQHPHAVKLKRMEGRRPVEDRSRARE